MIRVMIEQRTIMPFNINQHGRETEDFFGTVGNVSAHDYQKFEKGKDSHIEWMTCDEYIDKCINDIFDSNYKSVVTNAVDMSKVKEYANAMRTGEIFPLPYLNYVSHLQEGRHRMFAFKSVCGSQAKAPVLVITPTEDNISIEEIENYCKQRWGKYWEDFYNSMVQKYFGNTDEEYEDESDKEDSSIDDIDIPDDEDLENTLQYLSDQSGYSVQEIQSNLLLFSRLLDKYF